jgi:hypothetical protein
VGRPGIRLNPGKWRVLPLIYLPLIRNKDTKEVATNVNQRVRDLITTDDDNDNETSSPERSMKNSERMDCDMESVEYNLDLGSVLTILTSQLSNENVLTRLAVLKWVLLLLDKTPSKVR